VIRVRGPGQVDRWTSQLGDHRRINTYAEAKVHFELLSGAKHAARLEGELALRAEGLQSPA